MRLILARHGNTFMQGQEPVWVGANEDLALTTFGCGQAGKITTCLTRNKIKPAAIYTAGLKRTKTTAEIIAKQFDLTPIIDSRLREIDYGSWGGKTNQQITDLYGQEMLKLWTEQSVVPPGSGWQPDLQAIREQTRSLVAMLQEEFSDGDDILIVSSNGRLRYYLDLVSGEFDRRVAEKNFKMATGNLSCIELAEENRILFWNQKPDDLKI